MGSEMCIRDRIPVGTGMRKYRDVNLDTGAEKEDETDLEDLENLDDFSDLAVIDGVEDDAIADMAAEAAVEIAEEELEDIEE